MSVCLAEVIKALRERGEDEEASYCELMIPFELSLLHGFTIREILKMSMNEIEAWYNTPPKPLKYEGWNYWRGKSA